MALTKQDLQDIRGIVKEVVVDVIGDFTDEIIEPRFDALENRMDNLEKDVATLKSDVAELKGDVAELKGDVTDLKYSVADLQKGQHETNQRLSKLELMAGNIKGTADMLDEDVHELYRMVTELQRMQDSDNLAERPTQDQILYVYGQVKFVARNAGVKLPAPA